MKKTYLTLKLKDKYLHLNRHERDVSIHEVIYEDGTIRYAGGIRGEVDVLPIDRPWNYSHFEYNILTEDEAFLEMV